MMNPEVREEWKAALRSDEYQQGQAYLRQSSYGENVQYCCLGVLCEVAVKHGIIPEPEQLLLEEDEPDEGLTEEFYYGHDTQVLPRIVKLWAGLDSSNPEVVVPSEWLSDLDGDMTTDLADCNDSLNLDFSQIADLLDQL